MAAGQGEPLVQLSYAIHDFSSYSREFSPKHILVNKPWDQKSRWLSDGNKPPQYVTVKLPKPAIVCKILFGKYEKSHPCNVQKLRVYGGLDAEHTHLFLEGGLNNDDVPETLDLQCCTSAQPLPTQYLKVVPLQSWGGGFNFSIWHVQLWGMAEEVKVEAALASVMQFREREAVRLCLKHLRQYDYSEAFVALQKKSKIALEDPILTLLHHELVTAGRFEAAESILCRAMEEGFFDGYISRQLIQAKWTSIPYPAATSVQCSSENALPLTPDMRGGHQMCIDPDAGQLFLYGGWNGSRELGDLWQFTIASNTWTCLSLDTLQEGGPGPKSCHAMCFIAEQGALYVLGGFVEAPTSSEQESSPQCELYMCSVATNNWQLLSSDTFKDGGPRMIYDHQMCYDNASGLVYVLGGRIISTDLCSGLYAYHTVDKHWLCLAPDQSHNSSILPRSGHVTLFHPRLHQIFIIGGQRQQEILSDMVTYDVRSGETTILADGKNKTVPVTDSTLRGTLDLSKDQICLSGLNKSEERELKGCISLWLYEISTAQWSRIMRDETVPLYDIPSPRYAHSFVCDSTHGCYYMFGGNPGNIVQAKSNSTVMRLDDFWQMQLVRQCKENFLRECHLSLRKQRYIELSCTSPVDAVVYLKTSVSAVVDHNDHDESRQYRVLTGALFNSENSSASGKISTSDFLKMRSELYNNIAACFPSDTSQPKDNLMDFIRLKQ